MNQTLYFEDLKVGDRWRSRARTITETDVVCFAGLTGDYDPLHMDHEFVKQSPFGRPIAHGLLGLSFVAGLGSHFPMVHTVAFVAVRNWEFLRPAFIGDTVHAVNEVAELKDAGRRRGTVLWKRQLVNYKGEVVQQGIFETLVARSPAGKSASSKPATGQARRKMSPGDQPKTKPRGTRRRSRSKDKGPSS